MTDFLNPVRTHDATARVASPTTLLTALPSDALAQAVHVLPFLPALSLEQAGAVADRANRSAAAAFARARRRPGPGWPSRVRGSIGRTLSSGAAVRCLPIDGVLAALERAPVVLAAPCHHAVPDVAVAVRRAGARVAVHQTRLADLYVRSRSADAVIGCDLQDERALLARARMVGVAPTVDAVAGARAPHLHDLWIVFVDHQRARRDGCWPTTVGEQPFWMGLGPALLAARSGAAIWTLDAPMHDEHVAGAPATLAGITDAAAARAHDPDAPVVLRPCAWAPGVRSALDTATLDDLYADVGVALANVLRADGGGVLSWSRLGRSLGSAVRVAERHAAGGLRAFVNAWQSHARADAAVLAGPRAADILARADALLH